MVRQRRRFLFLILFLGLNVLLLGSWTALRAAAAPTTSGGGTLTVTRLDDPTPDGCNAADCSLREAIIAANAMSGTVINFGVTGVVELSLSGTDEDDAATGDLDINAAMDIEGQSQITVDGNGLDRVFDLVLEAGESVNLNGLTILGGNVTVPVAEFGGGGVRATSTEFTFAELTLSESVIRDNTVVGGYGGGVSAENIDLFINTSALISNTAANAGGVYVADGTTNIYNTTISQNKATNDTATVGGVFFLSVLPQISRLNLDSATIADNSDSGFGIQAINPGAARANFRNTVFAYNSGQNQCRSVGTGSIEYESSGYNLSTDGSCRPSESTDLGNTDPLLGALVNDHYEPASNSPVLDSGSTNREIDQLGNPRPVDLPGIPNTADGDDRGATELQGAGPTAITLGGFEQSPLTSPYLFMLAGIGTVILAGWAIRRRRT